MCYEFKRWSSHLLDNLSDCLIWAPKRLQMQIGVNHWDCPASVRIVNSIHLSTTLHKHFFHSMCYLAQPYRLLRLSRGTWNCSTSCLSLSQAISNFMITQLTKCFSPLRTSRDFIARIFSLSKIPQNHCYLRLRLRNTNHKRRRRLNFAVPAVTHKIRPRNIQLRKSHIISFLGPLFFPSPGAEGNGEERLLEWSWVTCTSWWIHWKTAVSASSRNSGNSL